jgi:hypothetical protein
MTSTPATPEIKVSQSGIVSSSQVKIAIPGYILFDDGAISIEQMTDMVFQDIGGQEIISLARNDLINGQNIVYQPIKNLTSLYFQYNPQNIVALQQTSEVYFENFPIKLELYIPTVGTGPNGEIVYVDPDTGNVVINTINMTAQERVEVQILKNGQVISDTIY